MAQALDMVNWFMEFDMMGRLTIRWWGYRLAIGIDRMMHRLIQRLVGQPLRAIICHYHMSCLHNLGLWQNSPLFVTDLVSIGPDNHPEIDQDSWNDIERPFNYLRCTFKLNVM